MENRPSTRRRLLAAVTATVAALAVAMLPGSASAVTTWHTGSGRPALAVVGSRLYVAWAGSSGTAAAKELDFGYSTDQGANIVKLDSSDPAHTLDVASYDGHGGLTARSRASGHQPPLTVDRG